MSFEQDDQCDDSPILDCNYASLPSLKWVPSNLDSPSSFPQCDMQTSNNIPSFIPLSEQERVSTYENTWTVLTASLLNDDGSPSSMQTTPHSDNRQKIMSPPGACHLTELQICAFTDWWLRSSNTYQWLASVVPRQLDEKPGAHFTRVIKSLPKSKCPKEACQAWKAFYRVIKICTDSNFERRQEVKRNARSRVGSSMAPQPQASMTTQSFSMVSVNQPQDPSGQTSQGLALEVHNHPALECSNPSTDLEQVKRTIENLSETLLERRSIEDHATFASLTPAQALAAGAWEALLLVKDK